MTEQPIKQTPEQTILTRGRNIDPEFRKKVEQLTRGQQTPSDSDGFGRSDGRIDHQAKKI